jgi:drug/metabolite transporter (DMT)-like permease
MLGVAAAIVFGIAFVVNATSTSTDAVFAPTSLIAAGLCLLALHLSGWGAALKSPRKFRR